MKFEQLLSALTPGQYATLKRSVELGKWLDGRMLTDEEKQMGLQLLIAYDARHKPVEDRLGYIPPAEQTNCDQPTIEAISESVIAKGK